MASACRFREKLWPTIPMAMGTIAPPPTACTARKNARIFSPGLRAQSTEPAIKIKMETLKMRRSPKTSATRPITGMTTV